LPKRSTDNPVKNSGLTRVNGDQSISFIDRISSILLALNVGKKTVTEIAQWCNLNVSTTHRLLNLLKEPGFTIYDSSNHRYYLGPLINQLAANPDIAHQFLVVSTEAAVKELAGYTGETVNLSLLFGLRIESIQDIPSKHSLKVLVSNDDEISIHSLSPLGSSQKVLLSQLSEARLNAVLHSIKLINDPLIDVDNVKAQLSQIRKQGFCISYGERVPDAIGISAPILHYTCPLALTIVGPETRMKSKISEYTARLLNSANHMSDNIKDFLVYHPSSMA
jgi:DNA-binding IclR family transcriptional regulator